jgi:hypothetical protein
MQLLPDKKALTAHNRAAAVGLLADVWNTAF